MTQKKGVLMPSRTATPATRHGLTLVRWDQLIEQGHDPIKWLKDQIQSRLGPVKPKTYVIWINERSYQFLDKDAAIKAFRKHPHNVLVLEAITDGKEKSRY